jgi:YVTN family beta-propeller protein
MPNRVRNLRICFPVISTLLVTSCMLLMYNNNSEAQVSENTLESVVNRSGAEEPQIISGDYPLYIYGDYELPTIYVANKNPGTVTVIDTGNNTLYQNLRVGLSPVYIYGEPLPNDTSQDTLYVADSGSGTVSLINATIDTVNPKSIFVGISPVHIYGDLSVLDTIYVANSGSDSISVINTTTNTVNKVIPVGEAPVYVYGDLSVLDTIYVANSGSDSISVINTTTNTVNPKPIFVGISPVHISANLTSNLFGDQSTSDTIYVANSGSDSISVINTTTNTVNKVIPVGEAPVYVYVDPFLGDVYVANRDSGGVSVINGKTNEAVAGVTFNVIPFRGGDIHCNINNKDLEAPINRFLYVSAGTKCIAKPSKGFEFSSWGETLEGNSTRTINETSGSPPWSALLDIFNIKSNDPASSLTVNRFGNFTSHFRALPPAIPSEYLIPVYGIIISTVVGFSIPSIITWLISKKQTARLNLYHQEMTDLASLYDDGKLDENDIDHLDRINKNIINAYSQGKINNEQHSNLKNEISVIYQEIFKKRVNSFNHSGKKDADREIIKKIEEDIKDAYSKGKISELHYNLLNEKVTKMTSKNYERE